MAIANRLLVILPGSISLLTRHLLPGSLVRHPNCPRRPHADLRGTHQDGCSRPSYQRNSPRDIDLDGHENMLPPDQRT